MPNPLLFADWHKINQIFCVIMWMVVVILATLLILHGLPPQHVASHSHLMHPPVRP